MKKVFIGLTLSSLLAVLAIPAVTFAAPCSSSCSAPVSVDCTCGGYGLQANVHYCYNNQYYSSQAACQAAIGGTTTGEQPPQIAPKLIESGAQLIGRIETIGNWAFSFLLAVAGVFLIAAGFFWVTAGGNPENVNKARTMLINALIGVVIALLARGLIAVVRTVLGG